MATTRFSGPRKMLPSVQTPIHRTESNTLGSATTWKYSLDFSKITKPREDRQLLEASIRLPLDRVATHRQPCQLCPRNALVARQTTASGARSKHRCAITVPVSRKPARY